MLASSRLASRLTLIKRATRARSRSTSTNPTIHLFWLFSLIDSRKFSHPTMLTLAPDDEAAAFQALVCPSTAPNPKRQLRINTSFDHSHPADYLDPPPKYQSHIETVKTAPLLLQPPPPRRAISQDVDAMSPGRSADVSRPLRVAARPNLDLPSAAPPTPPPTRPRPAGAGHGRKISDKFKSIFSHVRRGSEPQDVHAPEPIVSGILPGPARRIAHRRNESAPGGGDARIMQWIHETAVQGSRSPPRPHRPPNTASFIVTADSRSSEPVFPRFDPTAQTMTALHIRGKVEDDGLDDENAVVEPITAALYPVGKGLLGTTQRRAHLEDSLPGLHRLEVSHFSSPASPASRAQADRLDVIADHAPTPSASSGDCSFDAMWYMYPRIPVVL